MQLQAVPRLDKVKEKEKEKEEEEQKKVLLP
jgi:hypothetical protein